MRSLCVMLLSAAFIVAVGLVLVPSETVDDDGTRVVRVAGSETDPVAVIGPLPEVVSNGTECILNALSSYDPTNDYTGTVDTITDWTWEITRSDDTVVIEDPYEGFVFEDTGLYMIKLTVMDDWGNEGTAYTAVMCVVDADFDGMPDWWEVHYFGSTDGEASDDHDHDGYTDLEEWVLGTDPGVAEVTEEDFLAENWPYLVGIVLFAVVVLALVLYDGARRRRKDREAKKIEYAIEIEKSLED